jgi:hypothetical protein
MRFLVALWSILFNTGFISGFFINKPPVPSRIRALGEDNKKYPFSQKYFERYIKRLNSKNITEQSQAILNEDNDDPFGHIPIENLNITNGRVRIIINKNIFNPFLQPDEEENDEYESDRPFGPEGPNGGDDYESYRKKRGTKGRRDGSKGASSEHFEIVKDSGANFQSVGGYDSIKTELEQCIDILKNTSKYARYNVNPQGTHF